MLADGDDQEQKEAEGAECAVAPHARQETQAIQKFLLVFLISYLRRHLPH